MTSTTHTDRSRGIRVLARSLFRELSSQGYREAEIVALATQLLGEVATSIELRRRSG